MQITIFAAGSRGDIQPCIALGRGLQHAGYGVRLAAPQNFADFIEQHGVRAYPLRGDVQQVMASDEARKFMGGGGANPLKSIRAMRTLIEPLVMEMAADVYAACQEADALICLGIFAAFGQTVAESLRIPLMLLEPAPLLPTRAFPAPSWPIQRNLGPLHNYLAGVAMLQVLWQWYCPFVNAFRPQLGLPAYTFGQFHRTLRSTPMLSAYSLSIIPHPADWPASVHITGAFFLDAETGWQPPAELEAFLAGGDPPVYIGFGSMAGRNPQEMAALVVEALAQSGQRGLLVTGWGGMAAAALPETVFAMESAPHDWLFRRMAAVVHHGGAGTTMEGLRAGIPTVIIPFAFDQHFWGARIHASGLGPRPIPQKKLTANSLAQAIQTAVTDGDMRGRAAACGAVVRAENGVGKALGVVEQVFGKPRAEGAEQEA